MSERKEIIIALDVMGADRGPGLIIAGGIGAARQFGPGIKIILVGRLETIKAELKRYRDLPTNIDVHHAEDEVSMTDIPAEAVRRRHTSIAEAFLLHRDNKVDAVVSSGNTGAVMGTAMVLLGRLREVKRPAIASFFPNVAGGQTLFLDVGANADCKPLHLHQFAVMGSIVADYLLQKKRPRIGLLSIGEEKGKGNELILETYALLEADKTLCFAGNIEGRDILMDKVEVVIADGFVGNIVLKFAESVEGFLTISLRRQVSSNLFSRFGAMLLYPFLRRLRNTFDYAEYGGASLLGINGVGIVCHGESSPQAIVRALVLARNMVSFQVTKRIEAVLMGGDSGSTVQDRPDGVTGIDSRAK